MKRISRFKKNYQGFTFIEILIAVSIVAFLGASLYATFAAGLKLDRRAKQSFADLAQMRLILDQLDKDFGRIVNYDFRGSYPDQKSFFFDKEKLVFLIEQDGKLKWVRYRLAALDKGEIKQTRLGVVTKRNISVTNLTSSQASLRRLVREEHDFFDFLGSRDVPQTTVLLSQRVSEDGWKIQCAPSLVAMPKIEWNSAWDKSFLPAAVKISFSFNYQGLRIKNLTRDFIIPFGGQDEP